MKRDQELPQPVNIWKQLLAAALIAAAGSAVWYNQDEIRAWTGLTPGTDTVRSARRSSGVPVIVAPVELGEDNVSLQIVGTGKAKRSVMLRSAVEGKIVEMPLVAGKHFKAGDTLVRVDDDEQRVALELARAELAEATNVRKRLEKLQTTGSATKASLDQAATAEQVAKLQVELAKVQLEDRKLRAPFPGVAGIPSVEQGAWVDNGVEIASFDDRSQLLVEFDVPEGFLSRITPGAPVTAITPTMAGREFIGEVVAIDSRIASDSRTSKVRVVIPNEDDTLRPGSSFTIKLDLPGETYPVVPELALQFSLGKLHIWRVIDNKAEKVEVRMIARRNGNVLLDGPLSAEDIVVVEGAQRLTPGRELEILKTRASSRQQTS